MTTSTAEIGASKDLSFTFTDRAGTLTNPDAIALDIREPDGVLVSKTKADMAQVSTGVWRYVYPVSKAGRHWFHADAGTNVEAAGGGEFYAMPKGTA